MIDIEQMHEDARDLESLLRLQSMPIALKMLRREEEIPEDAVRPLRDLGHHLSFCQALALSRRRGLTIAETLEDMWCFEPVVGLGFVEPPRRFLEGHNRYPGSASTLEAGATWASNMPRFDYPIYSAVVTAPLEAASFEPDILMLYGKMSIPCGGDLRRTGCDDYSMVFSAPAAALGDLLAGLRAIRDTGCGLPSSPSFAVEYSLEESYVEIGRSIGMDWVK